MVAWWAISPAAAGRGRPVRSFWGAGRADPATSPAVRRGGGREGALAPERWWHGGRSLGPRGLVAPGPAPRRDPRNRGSLRCDRPLPASPAVGGPPSGEEPVVLSGRGRL